RLHRISVIPRAEIAASLCVRAHRRCGRTQKPSLLPYGFPRRAAPTPKMRLEPARTAGTAALREAFSFIMAAAQAAWGLAMTGGGRLIAPLSAVLAGLPRCRADGDAGMLSSDGWPASLRVHPPQGILIPRALLVEGGVEGLLELGEMVGVVVAAAQDEVLGLFTAEDVGDLDVLVGRVGRALVGEEIVAEPVDELGR